jgi:hypothetical protein
MSREPLTDFEKAAEEPAQGILAEYWDFLCHNKKWWLLPILALLLILSILVLLSASAAAPFIYTLF